MCWKPFARAMYSAVRVPTRMISPSLRNSGTRTTAPVLRFRRLLTARRGILHVCPSGPRRTPSCSTCAGALTASGTPFQSITLESHPVLEPRRRAQRRKASKPSSVHRGGSSGSALTRSATIHPRRNRSRRTSRSAQGAGSENVGFRRADARRIGDSSRQPVLRCGTRLQLSGARSLLRGLVVRRFDHASERDAGRELGDVLESRQCGELRRSAFTVRP